MERDLLYAYQRLKDTTKDAEPVEDHLPASIHQGASNLHSDKDMEDKIKLSDPRVQKLIRTYLEVFRELPPPASCDKLVQMDLKLKPELVGHKIRRRPHPAPKEQADEIERQIQECTDAGRSHGFLNVAHVWILFFASYAILPCTSMLLVQDRRGSALLSLEAQRCKDMYAASVVCEYCPKVSGELLRA